MHPGKLDFHWKQSDGTLVHVMKKYDVQIPMYEMLVKEFFLLPLLMSQQKPETYVVTINKCS